jgi:LmbE family N-acetylglucosaminyl deacetylase
VVAPVAPRRVLVVTAHPDDVDFACGGTVARLAADGADVALVVATDGQTGGFDATVPRDAIAEIRRQEQRAAAAVLGIASVRFLGLVDGELEPTLELRRAIAREVRRHRPEVVLTWSPERDWDRLPGPGHPDHLAVGEATVRAVYPDARNPFAFPALLADEGLEPHIVTQVWLVGGPGCDHVVDVTAHLETKLAAVRCHTSQLSDPVAAAARVRDWAHRNAEEAGLPADRAAERFRVVATA